VIHGRSPVAAAVLVLVGSAGLAAPAGAQQTFSTVDQAAGSVKFPLFVPGRTFGTSVHEVTAPDVSQDRGCLRKEKSVVISFTRHRPRRSMSLIETGKPCFAAHPDGAKVRRVRVHGRRVSIWAFCAGTAYACSHERRGDVFLTAVLWLRSGAGRTRVQFTAAQMSIRQTVRALRSLRLVDLTRPVVQLHEFMSPDQSIFCQISNDLKPYYTWCVISQPFRSGWLGADGFVGVCNMDPNGCIPGGGSGVPPLHPGQTSRLAGFSCTAEAAAITCTIAKGEHAGHGFRIEANAAVEVAPP
jgi:hypothetical protein